MTDIFALLEDILKHVGKIADREIASGSQHHLITALISTTERHFVHNAFVELNKVIHVVLEFYEPYLRCTKCFAPDHVASFCSYQPPLLPAIAAPPPIMTPVTVPRQQQRVASKTDPQLQQRGAQGGALHRRGVQASTSLRQRVIPQQQ